MEPDTFNRAISAIGKALAEIDAHKGQDGYRKPYDLALHVISAIGEEGLKLVRRPGDWRNHPPAKPS